MSVSECGTCLAGYACPVLATFSRVCPVGTFSASSATSCSNCSAGYACPASSTSSSPASAVCASGTFSVAGATSCSNCSAGYVCPSPGADNGTVLRCSAGNFSEAGWAVCQPCFAGFVGESTALTSGTCSGPCPTGTFSLSGSTVCSNCSAGQYGSAANMSVSSCSGACPAGRFSLSGATSCSNCSAGRYGSSASMSVAGCTDACPLGTFSLAGATSCSNCSAGRYGSSASMPVAGCTDACPPGRFSAAAATSCTNCSGGYACPAGSTTATPATALCGVGRYCPSGGAVCLPCFAGRYGNVTGAAVVSCSGPCEPGYFCVAGSASATAEVSRALDSTTTCRKKHELLGRLHSHVCLLVLLSCCFSSSSLVLRRALSCVVSLSLLRSIVPSSLSLQHCGNASVFCQLGSSSPRWSTPGYFTVPVDVNASLRTGEIVCDPGAYCVSGELVRHVWACDIDETVAMIVCMLSCRRCAKLASGATSRVAACRVPHRAMPATYAGLARGRHDPRCVAGPTCTARRGRRRQHPSARGTTPTAATASSLEPHARSVHHRVPTTAWLCTATVVATSRRVPGVPTAIPRACRRQHARDCAQWGTTVRRGHRRQRRSRVVVWSGTVPRARRRRRHCPLGTTRCQRMNRMRCTASLA